MSHPAWSTSMDDLQRPLADEQYDASHTKAERRHMRVMGVDPRGAARLHELRKSLRELRYSLELMAPVYELQGAGDQTSTRSTYAEALKGVMEHQEVLGIMQVVARGALRSRVARRA